MKRSYQNFLIRLEAAGLRTKLERRALLHHVSLLELYEGPNRAPSITAARRDAYRWLMGEGKGNNEVARLFDRTPSSVANLVQTAADRGKKRKSVG